MNCWSSLECIAKDLFNKRKNSWQWEKSIEGRFQIYKEEGASMCWTLPWALTEVHVYIMPNAFMTVQPGKEFRFLTSSSNRSERGVKMAEKYHKSPRKPQLDHPSESCLSLSSRCQKISVSLSCSFKAYTLHVFRNRLETILKQSLEIKNYMANIITIVFF